ncbi:hypothetical protein F1880_001265 [Penicillium rolfsii]|nr:hypothetical protein F1880_001265 [Penicillium rolfsii]
MKVDPERVIAAIIAANPKMRLDYGTIARMYGEGAKYNTMEHKFRAWRKQAEILRATDGDGSPQVQAQATPRTPRTPTTGGNKTGTPSKSKAVKTAKAAKGADSADTVGTAAGSVEDISATIIDISGEDVDPIKPEIKLENEKTRALLGIKSYVLEDSDADDTDIQVLDGHAAKRQKVERDLDNSPAKLPSLKPERGPRIDSQANGYDLPSMTTTDTHENVFASLNTVVRASGAFDPVFSDEA